MPRIPSARTRLAAGPICSMVTALNTDGRKSGAASREIRLVLVIIGKNLRAGFPAKGWQRFLKMDDDQTIGNTIFAC